MSTSAEPARSTAYGRDIAIRVVWQRIGMGLSFRNIAKRLQIGVGSAHRLFQRYIRTGEFSCRKKSSTRPNVRKLDQYCELYIIALLLENPGLYLAEICQRIEQATGIVVSGSTVCRLLKRNGITRKKISQIAKQRSEVFRGVFMAQMMLYPTNFFVWLDEMGSDKRDQIRRFGYHIRGLTPVYRRRHGRGTRVSSIAAICSEGLISHEIVTGTTNGEKFYDFIRGSLVPNMQPFPAPRSIIILDNCSIHHIQPVKDLLQSVGILLIYLPPYSPDYNPCEEMFSFVKYYLKDHDEILQSTTATINRTILQAAFNAVTKSLCINWIKHAGYTM